MQYFLFLVIPIAWTLWSAVSLAINYSRARHLNLPIITVPFSPDDALWIVVQPLFLPLLERLPFGNGTFTRYCRWGFEFPDKAKTYQELGGAWIMCTPKKNWVYLCDADAVDDVFTRRNDFIRPLHVYEMLKIFGGNVATVEGHEWKRHRKITAAAFTEQCNGIAWKETLQQAEDMLKCWTTNDLEGNNYSAKDVRTLSLNVLARAVFNRSYSFYTAPHPPKTGGPASYRETLCTILDNTLLIMVLHPTLLSLSLMPRRWRKIGRAIVEFKRFMSVLVDEERRLIVQGTPSSGNMISSLLKTPRLSSKDLQELNQGSGDRSGALTESEIFGNIFMYNFAGHDTTANTLAYGVVLLAAHPEVQDWIHEEICHVVKDERSELWDYEETFPRLKRCMAVLLETVRLYGPAMGIPKWTAERAQSLRLKDQTITIPPRTMVVSGVLGLQTHPQYWGPDALVWRPSRWITPATPHAHESLRAPRSGAYIAWSGGPRVCPGKKLSQVEVVAVLARLFRTHAVRPVQRAGEDPAAARRRVCEVVEDSQVKLTLQMREPGRVALRWERR